MARGTGEMDWFPGVNHLPLPGYVRVDSSCFIESSHGEVQALVFHTQDPDSERSSDDAHGVAAG